MSCNDDYGVDSESLNKNEDAVVRICAGCGCEFCIDCRDDA